MYYGKDYLNDITEKNQIKAIRTHIDAIIITIDRIIRQGNKNQELDGAKAHLGVAKNLISLML